MRRLLAVTAGLILVPLAAQAASGQGNPPTAANSVSHQRSAAHGHEAHLTLSGTTTLRSITAAKATGNAIASTELAPDPDRSERHSQVPSTNLPAPRPANRAVRLAQSRSGWQGLNHADQRLADNGNQFSSEPPDQGLCVGKVAGVTYVFESVNSALTVYDSASDQLIAPVSVSRFFGLPPSINRTTGRFGPFVSDPKCYYDRATGHWFHTSLVIGLDPTTGAFTSPAYTVLAVSKTSDPLGSYFIYRIDAQDRGQPNCPCFGDQPLIGADSHGFYVSTAEYNNVTPGVHFNGAQLYAMDKRALEAGRVPTVIHFNNLTRTAVNGRTTGTLQPAISAGAFATGNGGTEYFMSAFDCVPGDCAVAAGQFNKISVWALTNTQSLTAAHPQVTLTRKNLTSEVYGQPPLQTQRPGPRPLGTDPTVNTPLAKVTANDSRMNQVVYAAGQLWGGVNTAVAPGPRAGIGYFVVHPRVTAGHVDARITNQGYLAAAHANLSFPSIGVNAAGRGVIAYSLIGPGYFPSAAYSRITTNGSQDAVRIVRLGFRPEDGFSCYPAAGGDDSCRWGDYSASVAGPDGRIWSATEMVPDQARTINANWGTFVWPVSP